MRRAVQARSRLAALQAGCGGAVWGSGAARPVPCTTQWRKAPARGQTAAAASPCPSSAAWPPCLCAAGGGHASAVEAGLQLPLGGAQAPGCRGRGGAGRTTPSAAAAAAAASRPEAQLTARGLEFLLAGRHQVAVPHHVSPRGVGCHALAAPRKRGGSGCAHAGMRAAQRHASAPAAQGAASPLPSAALLLVAAPCTAARQPASHGRARSCRPHPPTCGTCCTAHRSCRTTGWRPPRAPPGGCACLHIFAAWGAAAALGGHSECQHHHQLRLATRCRLHPAGAHRPTLQLMRSHSRPASQGRAAHPPASTFGCGAAAPPPARASAPPAGCTSPAAPPRLQHVIGRGYFRVVQGEPHQVQQRSQPAAEASGTKHGRHGRPEANSRCRCSAWPAGTACPLTSCSPAVSTSGAALTLADSSLTGGASPGEAGPSSPLRGRGGAAAAVRRGARRGAALLQAAGRLAVTMPERQ